MVSFDFSVKSVTFSDGTTVALPPHGVIAFVGPNNVGKTVALRDIVQHIRTGKGGSVLRRVELNVSGGAEDLAKWLDTTCDRYQSLEDHNPHYRRRDHSYRWGPFGDT